METAQRKVEDAVNAMLVEIDGSHLRKVQSQSFKCAATCCDDPKKSMEDRQRCIGGCMDTVAKAQDVLGAELNEFQNRIERCVMGCQDQMKDKVTAEGAASGKLNSYYENCVISCADTNIKALPNITKRVQTQLGKF
ncbi:putative Protein FAM136A [Hypsibius exemplaris]|uniref:Protein FAM136A n=1 Tax=Hypsibius exemplaris TaxID=2072580 RepID=A0A1W0WA19_HYPEX|nr:putative Protein FAM136A [Hypsibius exemplaris]